MKVSIISDRGKGSIRETNLTGDAANNFLNWLERDTSATFKTDTFKNVDGEEFFVVLLRSSVLDVCVFP